MWLDVGTYVALVSALFSGGLAFSVLAGERRKTLGMDLALGCALLASLLIALGAVGFWQQPMTQQETLFVSAPLLARDFPPLTLDLFVDRLAAFFLLLVGLIGAGVALYSFVWLRTTDKRRWIAGAYNMFVLGTFLLLVMNSVFYFLLCLEEITLVFAYLTLYRHNLLLETALVPNEAMASAKRAFSVYLIYSHTGVIFISMALLLLALATKSFSFDQLRAQSVDLDPGLAQVSMCLALVGFGLKMAMVPFQSWMGLTHPYLPTSVHALVSSVVIKVVGIYGLIRVCFELLPVAVVARWSWLVLLLAGLSALSGVFYALVARDLKTALANHSVEHIGIILAGLGLAMLYRKTSPAMAGLALVAALYHLLNHALFKSLLFLATGAIEDRTGTVVLEHLGGLIQRFPWTAISFLIGTVAIAGFPPLNGFISEWLLLQNSIIGLDLLPNQLSPLQFGGLIAVLVMLCGAIGLTALAFVKIAGEAVLGKPRRPECLPHERHGDVPWPMRGVLLALAGSCVALGVFPGLVIPQLARIASDLALDPSTVLSTTATSVSLHPNSSTSFYAAQLSTLPLLLLVSLPLAVGLIFVRQRRVGASRGPWNCGTPYQSEQMQITGGAFAALGLDWAVERFSAPQPEADAQALVRPTQPTLMPWRLPLSSTRFVAEYLARLVDQALRWLLSRAQRFGDWFQGGDIRQYLLFLLVMFIVALLISVITVSV